MAESGRAPLFFSNRVPWGAMVVRATHAPFSESGSSKPTKLEEAMGACAVAVAGEEPCAHSWRAPQARSRRLTTCETALADLADLPRKSRRRSCLGRFLRRAHGDVPRALRVRSPPPSPPPSRTFQRDRLPYRGLDGAAGCRGLPARLDAPVSHP